MTADEYAKRLGKLMGNLQSLEFVLRGFLHAQSPPRPDGIPHGTDWYSFPVGAEVPLDEFTNYDSLRELIRKFNAEMKRRGALTLDEEALVALRDALAHGRVAAGSPEGDVRLLKFSKPRKGDSVVSVAFNEQLTVEWFGQRIKLVWQAVQAVYRELPQDG